MGSETGSELRFRVEQNILGLDFCFSLGRLLRDWRRKGNIYCMMIVVKSVKMLPVMS